MSTDSPQDIIRLRLSEPNRRTLAHGIEIRFLRIAEGIDGVYELEIKGYGDPPLQGGEEPPVPLKPDA